MIKALKQLSIKKPKDINIFMSKIKSSILDSNGKQFVVDRQELINVGEQSWPFTDSITVSQSLINNFRQVSTHQDIYANYSYMAGSAIITTALNLHDTQSLGAHKNTSDVFFLETKPDTSEQHRSRKSSINCVKAFLTSRIQ